MDTPLTLRERLAIRVLLYILRIVQPTEYQHQTQRMCQQIQNELTGHINHNEFS